MQDIKFIETHKPDGKSVAGHNAGKIISRMGRFSKRFKNLIIGNDVNSDSELDVASANYTKPYCLDCYWNLHYTVGDFNIGGSLFQEQIRPNDHRTAQVLCICISGECVSLSSAKSGRRVYLTASTGTISISLWPSLSSSPLQVDFILSFSRAMGYTYILKLIQLVFRYIKIV